MQKQKKYNTGIYYFTDKLRKKLEQLFEYPCTLIEAPMGYGKTTAIREFLNTTDSQILWQKIYDNSITGFWNSFCRLFDDIDDSCADSLRSIGFPSDSPSKEEVLRLLLKIDFSSSTVIVIDDYHLIDSPEVNQFIEFIVWNELDNLHMVLTARYSNIENQEELMLKGYLLHISKEMLEFEPKEINTYYKLCGINLKEDEVIRIYRYTEGWISALYLLMLGFKEEGSFAITANITKLIEKAVYLPFSDEMKEFLITVCLFDSFTREQAIFMWQKENAGELLTKIIKKNAFIRYDEKKKVYQIHNILSEFLNDIFESKNVNYKASLYRKAADWYMNNGDYITSMRYYYLLKDFDGILNALEVGKGHSIFYEHKDVFVKFYKECPEQIKRHHPIALLVYAMCLFTFNEMELFAEVCEEFEKAIQEDDSQDSETIQMLLGEFELLLCFTKYNDINKMLTHIKNSWELLKQPAKFIDCSESWTFGSPSVLYMFYREAGELEEEVHRIKEALPMYYQLTEGHGKGGEYVMEAERYYFCGDFNNAEILAYKAISQANSADNADILLCAYFLQTRIAIAKGDYANALTIYHKWNEEMKRNQGNNLLHTVHLCEAYILAGLQQVKSIPVWIREGDFLSSRLYFPTIAFLNIIYGRVLLLQGEYHKLLGMADQFMETASVFPNLLGMIYTHIYIAAVNEKLYRREAALTSLNMALDLAIPDAIYMPFVENGDYIRPLLEIIYRNSNRREITFILKLELSYQNAVQQIRADYFTKAKPKLSEREMEIARLVAEGMSNNEIGSRLFITQNTVKTLLKRIFEKLEINSRTMLKLYIESEI
ncbi:MAG TPA: LuxR C-terminal-related transcriptional regulator [Mobilitalea sp.]|nr:LuxR C-terminal-related transcriptional regulator [Mobilitalea sp.]